MASSARLLSSASLAAASSFLSFTSIPSLLLPCLLRLPLVHPYCSAQLCCRQVPLPLPPPPPLSLPRRSIRLRALFSHCAVCVCPPPSLSPLSSLAPLSLRLLQVASSCASARGGLDVLSAFFRVSRCLCLPPLISPVCSLRVCVLLAFCSVRAGRVDEALASAPRSARRLVARALSAASEGQRWRQVGAQALG